MANNTLPRELGDKKWRINNLYKIIDKKGQLVTFRLNEPQEILFTNLHTRNVIPKARQLGITTFFAIYMLDDVLFNANYNAVIIAHDHETMKKIFNKVKIAWKEFPKDLKDYIQWEAETDNKKEMRFNNYSSFSVTLSSRSDTVNHLHVSELGKICKEYPDKEEEILTGAFPSVVPGGIITIESTVEEATGLFKELYDNGFDTATDITTEKDFKRFFFPWTMEPKYALDATYLYDELPPETITYQQEMNLTNEQICWWHTTKKADRLSDVQMKRQYPTCIDGDQKIFTSEGIKKIKDVTINNKDIVNFFDQGKKQVWKIKTSLGYELFCTDDHKIKTHDGFKDWHEMGGVGATVLLSGGEFSDTYNDVKFNYLPFVNSKITIDEGFGRFIGYFMGDGSFTKNTIDFACCAEDMDVVKDISNLMEKYFGEAPNERVIGKKKGCINLRKSSIKFKDPLLELGLIKLRDGGGGYKRDVHIPSYILTSPKPVIVEFLKGLFEADGFVSRKGNEVKFFSKYKDFIQDVQLLLLNFGITSRLVEREKTSGQGNYKYIGYELSLRKKEAQKFKEEIGFVSKRKTDRLNLHTLDRGYNTLPLKLEDEIVSIELVGEREVYDITTPTHEFVAGGIIVHNCVQEAFDVAIDNYFNIDGLKLRLSQDTHLPLKRVHGWDLYEEYNPNHLYGIGADPAEGIGKDHSAAVLIDFSYRLPNYQIVPKVIGKFYDNRIDPQAFAQNLSDVGAMYGMPIIAPERNNHGHAVIGKLKEIYHNIYKETVKDITTQDQERERYGWLTSSHSKPALMSELRQAIDESHLIIPDSDILNELRLYGEEDYRRIKNDKKVTNHMDLVMALAIAWEMRHYATGSYNSEPEYHTDDMKDPHSMFQV